MGHDGENSEFGNIFSSRKEVAGSHADTLRFTILYLSHVVVCGELYYAVYTYVQSKSLLTIINTPYHLCR